MIIQECVPDFDGSILAEIFEGGRDAIPKSPFAVPSLVARPYTCKFMDLSPSDVDFPATGKRQFGVIVLQELCGSPLDVLPGVRGFLSAPLACCADVVLAGTEAMKDACLSEYVDKDGVWGIPLGLARWEDTLTGPQRSRLRTAAEDAANRGFCQLDPETGKCYDWTVPVAICNLDQSESWNQTRISCMPRMSKGSILWDMVQDRMILPEEYWVAMGWPVRGFIPSSGTAVCPHDVDGLSFSRAKQLMGNGMQIASIGAVCVWAVGMTPWKE